MLPSILQTYARGGGGLMEAPPEPVRNPNPTLNRNPNPTLTPTLTLTLTLALTRTLTLALTLALTRRLSGRSSRRSSGGPSCRWRRRRVCTCNMRRCSRASCLPSGSLAGESESGKRFRRPWRPLVGPPWWGLCPRNGCNLGT